MTTMLHGCVPWGGVLLGFAMLADPAHADENQGNAHGNHGTAHGDPGRHGHGDQGGNDECQDLDGAFTSAVDPSPGCASPVGFCTLGSLTGDLEGTYAFTMDSMVPVSDDPAETTFAFTGRDTITTADGVIYGEDSGQLTFSGDFAFMTIVRAVSGEGCFEDLSGTLVATGNLDLTTGVTAGTWVADFCGAEECFDEDDDGWPSHNGDCH